MTATARRLPAAAETTPVAEVPRGRGRPADPAKRAAILEAAGVLFLRDGYGATSMDAIAARAGVSKQTVYKAFPTKDALFGAIVAEASGVVTASLGRRDPDATPAEVLTSVGRQYLDLVLGDRAIPLLRVLSAERVQFPGLAQTFYSSGPAVTLTRIAAYLEEETRAGRLAVDEPLLAAEQFLGMMLGHAKICALLDVVPVSVMSLDHRVTAAVRTFLAAYGVRQTCAE